MSEYDLTPEELATGWGILQDGIDAQFHPQHDPVAVFVGAQPAAGKSHAQAELRSWYARPLLTVDSDVLRAHHPRFAEIMARDPQRMPILTNQAAGDWTRRTIDYARARHLDVMIENTFHTPEVILDSAEQFRAAGYRVHVAALAVPAEVSRLAMVDRYLTSLERGEAARWTTLAAHDKAVGGAIDTLRAVHDRDAVDRLSIIDRNAARHYDCGPDSPEWREDPAPVLVAARHAHWTDATRDDHARLYRHAAAAAVRTGSVTDHTRAVFAALVDDADRIAGPAVAGDSAHHELRALTQTHERSAGIAGLLADTPTRDPEKTADPFSRPDPFTASYLDHRARHTPTPEHDPGPHTHRPTVDPSTDPDLGL